MKTSTGKMIGFIAILGVIVIAASVFLWFYINRETEQDKSYSGAKLVNSYNYTYNLQKN